MQDKNSQAKAKLLVEYPYFGTLAAKLQLKVNDDIESFVSDGKKVEYREAYFKELGIDELAFIFANGAMHTALAHENRRAKRSGWLWQMASDMAINDMLVENGLTLPYGAHYRKRFAGMYAEEIYAELKADILRDDEDLEYEAESADDVEQQDEQKESMEPKEQKSEEALSPEALQEEILQEQLMAEEAIALLESEFKRGEAPVAIERFFTLEYVGEIDWRAELKSALDSYFLDDYMLLPPSKKLLYTGIYLPASVSQTFRLVIVVDSSGSVDEQLLDTFLSEINFLMSLVQNYQIELLVCDDMVHSHDTFYSGDTLSLELKGNGGTDFRPAFDFVAAHFDDVKLLLYFSDLAGVFPEVAPDYAVKWVTQKEQDVAFGEILLLRE